VPIDLAFLDALGGSGTALGRVAYQALSIERELISQGQYFAWDPLSAVALADPSAVTMTAVPITLLTQPPQAGRTLADPASPYRAEVALQADAARFGEVFLGALGAPLPAPTS
jgi:inosine-uridine nucleoside N-ribohydrolase